ncbi:MAG: nucleotidyltransferase family protein [Candidatus Taylorbacteria bacterium]
MEIIILAGGLGKRLSHVVTDVPKPMAPIKGVPFLVYVLEYISRFDFDRVIMATGYKSAVVEGYFGKKYNAMEIVYSVENKPLGTGGALKQALGFCRDRDICIINGDTYFDVDLDKMRVFHEKSGARLTIGLKKMRDFDRYGTIEICGDDITKFNEKKPVTEGYINGGIYFMNRTTLDGIKEKTFSFEKDYMEKGVSEGKFKGFLSDGYFIDIGVPEDYYRANKELMR